MRGLGSPMVLEGCKEEVWNYDFTKIQRNFGRDIVTHSVLREKFQQDNAPCHILTKTLTFFYENCIEVIPYWQSQSQLDLNLIKILWDYVKTRVKILKNYGV